MLFSELAHEVKIAMSSLIFASSICGQEFHELQLIQDLFRDIYGCDFIKTNVELLPGNFVDVEVHFLIFILCLLC